MADLRGLPKVDVLAASKVLERFSPAIRTQAARKAIEKLRAKAKAGKPFDLASAESLAVSEAERLSHISLRPAINATGIVLHTGLGRARLAQAAADQVYEIARGHSNVEIDLETGGRGDRQTHVRALLTELTGAEDALAVNNCAAAVMLVLAAHCRGKSVILSRGEMVEIGGAFRMPEVIKASGCRLVEVGCTNRTRLFDYEEAIDARTAAILSCHPSNYRVTGFTEAPSHRELSRLAKDRGILFIHDLGNGCLWDTAQFGLASELTIQDALGSGADLVTASGDKMLGGPQAGLILGCKDAVRKAAKHPMARAMRIDKLCLAALEATLRLHSEKRCDEIPTHRYLSRSLNELKLDAETLAKAFSGESTVELGESEVGAGSVPGEGIPSWRVGLKTKKPEAVAKALRTGEPAILARIEHGLVWLDPRTMEPDEVEIVAQRLESLEPT